MANEVTVAERCCLNCAYLLDCEDILQYRCREYVKAEPKSGLADKYNEQLLKIRGLVFDLVAAINNLSIVDTEHAVAEKTQRENEPEKVAISKRNKSIKEMIEKGLTLADIADELRLSPGTVKKELDYLLKIGEIKQLAAEEQKASTEA